MLEQEIQNTIAALLADGGFVEGLSRTNFQARTEFQPLVADGSSRRFIRVFCDLRPCCLAVLPGSTSPREFDEFRSSLAIARHLGRKGIPVPEVLAADSRHCLILFEDLGDLRLHGRLKAESEEEMGNLYRQVIDTLIAMQIDGAEDFDQHWCYDTETYDQSVMVEREAGYFYEAFWKDTLFAEEVDGLQAEFEKLADKVMEHFEPLFLHRDFQSRNIMLKEGQVRVIDFQAGRIGPPGYDIASLLIDPYAGLPGRLQDELLDYYLHSLRQRNGLDVERVKKSYPYLALQRNMQIIGAFAFLSGKKRKQFFAQFLMPSLIMLHHRMADQIFDDFPLLRKTAAESVRLFRSRFSV
jgi:hypothetical protein